MSWLGRLFGGRKPEDRLRDAVRLAGEGELGLARVELQAVIAANLVGRGGAEARSLLDDVTRRLARARIDDARAQLEAGDGEAARSTLEVVRALGPGPALVAECAEIERSLRDLDSDRRPAGGLRASAKMLASSSPLAEAPLLVIEDDEANAASAEPLGDDHLGPLEQVLLAFPEAEAERLAELAADDSALAHALSERGSSDSAALSAWDRIRETSRVEPLVRREHGRALLVAGREKEARALLEAALLSLPADLDTLELTMEARLCDNDSEAAAAIARTLLTANRVRDFGLVASVLARSGYATEALSAVDRALDVAPSAVDLWELRGSVCDVLGSSEGSVEADGQAMALYRQQCASCGSGTSPTFPLASGRRIAARGLAASPPDPGQREALADLLRVLITVDAERAAHWQEALAGL